jgi:hypothetical protein
VRFGRPAFAYPRPVELFLTALLIIAALAATGSLAKLAYRTHTDAGLVDP